MKKFLVTYQAPVETRNNKDLMTPDNMKKYMDTWKAWTGKCGSALLDFGSPLCDSQTVSNDGSEKSGSDIVGFCILQSEDIESAKQLLEGHPHLAWHPSCDIQIHEQMQMPG